MRSEFQDRIRRALDENPNHGYTRASPWSAVFAQAVKEGDFWTKEVVTPATLLLARNKSLPARQDDSSDSDRGGKKVDQINLRRRRRGSTPVKTFRTGTGKLAPSLSTGGGYRSVRSSTAINAAMAKHNPDAQTIAAISATFVLARIWPRSAQEASDRRAEKVETPR